MKQFSMLGFGLFIIVLPIILALISSLFKGGSIFDSSNGFNSENHKKEKIFWLLESR